MSNVEFVGMCKGFKVLLEEMVGAESPDFFNSVAKALGVVIPPENYYKSHGEYLTKTSAFLIEFLTRQIHWRSDVGMNENDYSPNWTEKN